LFTTYNIQIYYTVHVKSFQQTRRNTTVEQNPYARLAIAHISPFFVNFSLIQKLTTKPKPSAIQELNKHWQGRGVLTQ